MTIKRTIDGVVHEIKLTEIEMHDAFREQQRAYDAEDIKNWLDFAMENYLRDNPGVAEEEIMAMMPEFVKVFRESLDNDDYFNLAGYATDSVMKRRGMSVNGHVEEDDDWEDCYED